MRITRRLLAYSTWLSAGLALGCSNDNTVASARPDEAEGGSAGKKSSGGGAGSSGSSGNGGSSGSSGSGGTRGDLPQSCFDEVKNGDEEDVDCGGSCLECVCSGEQEQAICSGECVDLETDVDHCGECGKSCEGGEQGCVAGECVVCSGTIGPGRFAEPRVTAWALKGQVVDVDGDSKNDLLFDGIATPENEPDVYAFLVKLGDGKGGFTEERELARGRAPEVLDLNGDQHADIAYIHEGWTSVGVLYGDGHGAFTASEPLSVGLGAGALALVDLNHDARADIVVTNFESKDVSVLVASAEGGFLPEQRIPVEFAAEHIEVGDLNRDGEVDVVVGGEGVLRALFGDGEGGLEPSLLDDQEPLTNFTLANLDGDPWPDLVVALKRDPSDEPWVQGKVGVLLDYSGLILAGMTYHVAGSGNDLAIADVDGDGNLDIGALNVNHGAVDVLTGRGDGTLDPPRSYGSGWYPQGLAFGDLDQDSRVDLVTVGFDIEVIPNDGGQFGHRVYPTLNASAALVLADVTGDGVEDALATNTWGGNLVVHEGISGGFFREPTRVTHDPDNSGGYGPPIALGDFDRDGRLDIAIARDGVSIYGSSSEGGFEWRDTITWPGYITSLVTGDLDEDGQPDLIATEGYSDTLRVRLGKPDTEFEPATTYAAGDWPNDAVVIDVNGDSHLDVVVASFAAHEPATIDVFIGDGKGGLSAHPSTEVNSHPLRIAAADLDRDGKLDLVARYRGGFHVLRGDGEGGFTTLSTHEDGSLSLDEHATSLVAIEDFSGDGLVDVAVTIPDEGRIAVWRGTGDGGLLSPSYYTVGNNSALVSRDLDGDGRPDLAALGLDTVTVMLNQARCE